MEKEEKNCPPNVAHSDHLTPHFNANPKSQSKIDNIDSTTIFKWLQCGVHPKAQTSRTV